MAALGMLPFCSQKKIIKALGVWTVMAYYGMTGVATVTDVHMHHLLLLTQQNWDHNLIPVSSAALQELGRPSGCHLALSENMQLQTGCWGVREKMPGCFVWRQESACCATGMHQRRICAAEQEGMEVWKGTSEGRKPIVKVSCVTNSAGMRPLF